VARAKRPKAAKGKKAPTAARRRAAARADARPVRLLEREATTFPSPSPVPEVETALVEEVGTLLLSERQAVYDAFALARVRESLKAHQAKVARQMEQILQGQNLTLQDVKLPQEEDPREPPLERLRRYMRLLQATRQRLSTPGFGLCAGCGAPIQIESLVSFPWLMECAGCGR